MRRDATPTLLFLSVYVEIRRDPRVLLWPSPPVSIYVCLYELYLHLRQREREKKEDGVDLSCSAYLELMTELDNVVIDLQIFLKKLQLSGTSDGPPTPSDRDPQRNPRLTQTSPPSP